MTYKQIYNQFNQIFLTYLKIFFFYYTLSIAQLNYKLEYLLTEWYTTEFYILFSLKIQDTEIIICLTL